MSEPTTRVLRWSGRFDALGPADRRALLDRALGADPMIRDRTAASAMADRAYAAFLQNWTWDAIAPRVWAAAEDALRPGSRLAAQPA